MTDQPVRVLIADDHPVVREGLRNLLRRTDVDVVGEAETAEAAVAGVDDCDPRVVIMDLSLPAMGGAEAIRRIRARHPDVAVLVLTAFADRQRVVEAVSSGASGYMLKDEDPADLVAAIHASARGDTRFSAKIAAVLAEAGPGRPADQLTAREEQVLALAAEGLSNRQIADRLGITEGTVKAHLSSTFRRIGVRRRAQAVLWYHVQRRDVR